MSNMKKLATAKKYLPVALAVAAFATAGAATAFAKTISGYRPAGNVVALHVSSTSDSGYSAHAQAPATIHRPAGQSSPQLFMYAPSGPSVPTDAARDAAIHECNVRADKYSDMTWETMKSAVYGTCMAEHGQPLS